VPSERTNSVYEFGPFRLELREHRLMREGQPIPLTGKAFHTLRALVERHGELVSKQDLMSEIWPETTVEENNLDRNISMVRKALGDQSFIETVPRVGYRFVAPVSKTAPSPADRTTRTATRQEIRFCVTDDGARLAYAKVGSGHPIVKVADCFNHLDFEWDSPIWRHWVREFGNNFSLVRYDGRGSGLSDWEVEDVSFEAWIHDLEKVVDAAGLDKFALVGHSQGGAVAIAYAVRHPERVSHLVLLGGFAHGRANRDPEGFKTQLSLVRQGWGRENPAFRQFFTSTFVPDGTPEQMQWWNDLQRITTSPENAVRIMQAISNVDVTDMLPRVTVPTLVLHSRNDAWIPFDEGRTLAAGIPGARFVALESRNHALLEGEPAWQKFLDETEAFLAS